MFLSTYSLTLVASSFVCLVYAHVIAAQNKLAFFMDPADAPEIKLNTKMVYKKNILQFIIWTSAEARSWITDNQIT